MTRWMKDYTWTGLVLALGIGIAGCPSTNMAPIDPVLPGQTASALIGPEGGVLDVGSMRITVPAGAVTSAREVRVIVEGAPPPGAFTGFSPVVRFEPEGTTFAVPVEVRIPFEGDPSLATIFWSQHDGTAFVPRQTRVADGYAFASTTHFSSAFVGTACTGAACCDAANGELDLLLMVDNSNSMGEEQLLLHEQLPRLARILASGDRDGDGIQDFPALESIHVGVITSDLGAGDTVGVPTCGPGWGDDGRLRVRSRESVGACESTYESGISRYGESEPGTLEDFVAQVGCLANVGIGGCGFEQQLEATLLALAPSVPADYSAAGWTAPVFLGGRAGQGDGANAGFLRRDSMLAIVELTDENDTSVTDTGLFETGEPRFMTTPLNLRGYVYGDPEDGILQPITRYAEGLSGLRAQPADLIFGVVAGIPTHVIRDAAHVDYDALVESPAMMPTVNDSGTNLEPSCTSPNGVAYPPTRLVETARELDALGAGTVIASICDPTFDALIDGLIERIARRASGSCE